MDLVIGIDFGGTKMLGVAVNPDGEVLAINRVPTPYTGPELTQAMCHVVENLEQQTGVEAMGVGVGAAGLVDGDGILRYGPNVGGITNFDVLTGLREQLPDKKISVDNDATCAAWAECLLGAGGKAMEMMLVTLGTGIGGGVVAGGRPLRGEHGFAGEPGHMIVDVPGIRCICGRDGCWEAYVSGRALGRMGREKVAAGQAPGILVLAGAVDDVRSEHVAEAARSGDIGALEIMDHFARWLAIGVANLVALMDPQVVVIGGGLSEVSELYLPAAQDYYREIVFGAGSRPNVPILKATLGEQAGAIGAAMLIHRSDVINP